MRILRWFVFFHFDLEMYYKLVFDFFACLFFCLILFFITRMTSAFSGPNETNACARLKICKP